MTGQSVLFCPCAEKPRAKSSFRNTHHVLSAPLQCAEWQGKSCVGSLCLSIQLYPASATTNSRCQSEQCRQQCKRLSPAQPADPGPYDAAATAATATTTGAAVSSSRCLSVGPTASVSAGAATNVSMVAATSDAPTARGATENWRCTSSDAVPLTVPEIRACTASSGDGNWRAVSVRRTRSGDCPQRPVSFFDEGPLGDHAADIGRNSLATSFACERARRKRPHCLGRRYEESQQGEAGRDSG